MSHATSLLCAHTPPPCQLAATRILEWTPHLAESVQCVWEAHMHVTFEWVSSSPSREGGISQQKSLLALEIS